MAFASDKQRRFLFENHPKTKQLGAQPVQKVVMPKYSNLLNKLNGPKPLKLDSPPHEGLPDTLSKEEKKIKY